MALAYFADDVVDRNLCIVQNERTGRGAPEPHLVLFGASGNPGIVFLNNEATELLAVSLSKCDEQIGECGVRNPHFLAVQNPVSAIGTSYRIRLGRERVGTAARLRKRVSGNLFCLAEQR